MTRTQASRWQIVRRPCQTPWRFAFVLSAKGAGFIASLGQRPRIAQKRSISAEGAIHFPAPQLTTCTDLIRAFSACHPGIHIPEALPQADDDIAPLALNVHRSAEPGCGDASETDAGRKPSERGANESNALQPRGFAIRTFFT